MRRKSIVKKFMEETGYDEYTIYFYGIRKYNKKGNDFGYKLPSKMLDDFLKWQEKNK